MPGPALPLLETHRSSLEKCVYCPKLCRAACPVSNAEANETVTPWGKMSVAYLSARGDVPLDQEHAATAWACTGCFACRERCDHKNPVADVLTDARAAAFERGVAPAEAAALSARWLERGRETALQVDVLATQTDTDRAPEDATALLVGCGYVRRAPEVAADAVRASLSLSQGKLRPVRGCCGLPLLHAGDRAGFLAAAKRLAAEVAAAPRVIAVDPGCGRALLVEYARIGVRLPPVSLFVDLAAAERARLRPLEDLGPARWHDPCQLGRGLGRHDEPRAVLARIAPQIGELARARDAADCSGGGGLLPRVRPEASRAIAAERVEQHRRAGGGALVTHCAASLHRFRTAGEPAQDLVSLVARALRGGAAR